jgi:DNA-binding HxlR family transcriptional regulator
MTATASSDHPPLSDASHVESIEGRWTLQILLCLNGGALRFSDLRVAIPRISSNVLIDRIRALQTAGLVERRYLPPPAARHLYSLAPLATGLKPALDALAHWRSERQVSSPPPDAGCECTAERSDRDEAEAS